MPLFASLAKNEEKSEQRLVQDTRLENRACGHECATKCHHNMAPCLCAGDVKLKKRGYTALALKGDMRRSGLYFHPEVNAQRHGDGGHQLSGGILMSCGVNLFD